MSYEFYKVLHLVAVLVLFAVLGGVAVHAVNGGTRTGNAARRIVSALHGAALLVALVAGFGLVARLDRADGGFPPWIWGKLALWVVAGLLLVVPYRRPGWARPTLLFGLPILAAAAAYLAVFKPGN